MIEERKSGALGIGLAILLPDYLDDADAVHEELAQHFFGDRAHAVDDRGPGWVQVGGCDRFMVHAQQATARIESVILSVRSQAEVVNPIVVIAGSMREAGRSIRAVVAVVADTLGDRV